MILSISKIQSIKNFCKKLKAAIEVLISIEIEELEAALCSHSNLYSVLNLEDAMELDSKKLNKAYLKRMKDLYAY